MVTLIKYGALSGGEKYNVNVLSLDGLSTDTKPSTTYIEYGSDGGEVGRTGIPNGSLYTEIDTGDTYMYDADNTTWHKVSIGGGGGGGFTPTQAQLDAMNSGINSTKVAQITTNETNISLKANTSDVTTATANLQAQIDELITPVTQDAEVQNARVGADGETYATLKARCDADSADITEISSLLASDELVYYRPVVEYLGNYSVDSSGTVSYNANYHAYIYDITKLEAVVVKYAEILGFFSSKPKAGSHTSNNSRQTSVSNYSVTVASDKRYLIVASTNSTPAVVTNKYPKNKITNDIQNAYSYIDVYFTKSVNKYNKNSSGIIAGSYVGYDEIKTGQASNLRLSHLIDVKGGTEYKFNIDNNTFGNSAANIAYYETKEATEYTIIKGTSANGYVTFTPKMNGYIRFNQAETITSSQMFCTSTDYPSSYTAYSVVINNENISIDFSGVKQITPNVLYLKNIVFDGDSICDGSSEGTAHSGWAKRIGQANDMQWHNVGVGGATITAEQYDSGGNPRHWLSRYIDTIHTNYPTLDYLILEGGTNDADLLRGTLPTSLGTLDMSDFSGTYDDTNFTGALDTLFYKSLSYYPAAKIGFIIAHKMGAVAEDRTYTKDDNNRRYFFERAMEVCNKWGIPYINLWDNSPLNPSLAAYYNTVDATNNSYTDGQHLTSKGYDIITPKIEAWIRTL